MPSERSSPIASSTPEAAVPEPAVPGVTAEQAPRKRHATLRRFLRSRPGTLGGGVFLAIILVSVFAPLISPYSPLAQSGQVLQPPSGAHLLGTDELGRDILSRIIYGGRETLIICFGAAFVSSVIGIPLGLISAYLGSWVDAVIMRVLDVILSVPGILFALVVITVLGPGTVNLLLAIGIGMMPSFARITRASALGLREREYVLAAKAAGAGKTDIMFRTILPNIVGPLLVQLVVVASLAVISAAALSFLGLGAQPPTPSWGAMLQTSQSYMFQAGWFGVFPGIAIALAVAALDGIGRGLQAAFGTEVKVSRARVGAMA